MQWGKCQNGYGGGWLAALLLASPGAKRNRDRKACPQEHTAHRKQGLRNTVIYERQIKKVQSFNPASQLGSRRPFISLTFHAYQQQGGHPRDSPF